MRAGGKIGENFLLAKISTYTVPTSTCSVYVDIIVPSSVLWVERGSPDDRFIVADDWVVIAADLVVVPD